MPDDISNETPAANDDASARAQIIAILVRETGISPDRLTPDTPIRELDIESIDLVQAIFAIETQFDIEIPPGVEKEDATVEDFLGHVVTEVEKAQAARSVSAGEA